jgi:hypothetical protein
VKSYCIQRNGKINKRKEKENLAITNQWSNYYEELQQINALHDQFVASVAA